MDKNASWRVIDEQRLVVADLLEGLSDEQWRTPSLCDAWTVRDVGAHLSLAATARAREVLRYVVRARGNFDVMIREATIDRGKRPTYEIVQDLRDIVGSRRLAPMTFWRDPLLDIVVHGQDIARPLGLRIDPPVEAVHTAVDWAWQRRFPFFPARRLRGLRLVADDMDWSRGSGEELRGPALSLLLLSTGRRAGLADLTGPGRDLAQDLFATSGSRAG